MSSTPLGRSRINKQRACAIRSETSFFRSSLKFIVGVLCGVVFMLVVCLGIILVKPQWGLSLARYIEARSDVASHKNNQTATNDTRSSPITQLDNESAREGDRDAEHANLTEYTLEQQIVFLHEWAEGKYNERTGRRRWYDAVEAWSKADPSAALAFIAGAKRFPARTATLAHSLRMLAMKDPLFVRDWIINNIPERRNRSELVSLIIGSLGYVAPEQALALATDEGLKMHSSSIGNILGELAKSEPDKALQALSRLPETEQASAVSGLLGSWGNANYDAARTWCLQQKGGALEAAATVGVIDMCLRNNPEDLALVLQTYPGALKLASAYSVSELLIRDADLGMMVIQEFPIDVREEAVRDFLSEGVCFDPEGTMAIIRATLPEAEQKDAICSAFYSWRRSDQPAAMEWLAKLKDENLAESIRKLIDAGSL